MRVSIHLLTTKDFRSYVDEAYEKHSRTTHVLNRNTWIMNLLERECKKVLGIDYAEFIKGKHERNKESGISE